MLASPSPTSLRPVTRPAELALPSLMYASAPAGTITLLSTTIGASNEALNTCPAWFVFESMLSIVRTVTIVLAGTVTVTGCGGGGGAGVATGAAAADDASATGLAGVEATTWRDLSFFNDALVFVGRLAGSASDAGAAACGTVICAAVTLI